jgi:phosphoglycolate phosphatase
MVKILLFDIDGTLILTGGAGGDALHTALQQEFELAEPNRVPLHGRTDHGIVHELLASNGIPTSHEHVDRIKERYFQLLPQVLAERVGRVLPGVIELLTTLTDERDYQRSLLTGNMAKSARMKLSHYQLEHHFEGGVFGDKHGDRRDLGRDAVAVLSEQVKDNVRPEDVVIIGDTPLDIACARAIGCPVLAVATGGVSREELASHRPDRVVDDLSDHRAIMHWFDEVFAGNS